MAMGAMEVFALYLVVLFELSFWRNVTRRADGIVLLIWPQGAPCFLLQLTNICTNIRLALARCCLCLITDVIYVQM